MLLIKHCVYSSKIANPTESLVAKLMNKIDTSKDDDEPIGWFIKAYKKKFEKQLVGLFKVIGDGFKYTPPSKRKAPPTRKKARVEEATLTPSEEVPTPPYPSEEVPTARTEELRAGETAMVIATPSESMVRAPSIQDYQDMWGDWITKVQDLVINNSDSQKSLILPMINGKKFTLSVEE